MADKDKKGDGTSKEPSKAGDNAEEAPVEIEKVEDEEVDEGPPPAPVRDKWSSKIAFFLTLVGYAIGFGNIWRFPYQMRENGGLVFLVPYFIMLAVVGIPIFFMELAVGQRRRKGTVYAWAEMSPSLGGIGIACGWLCFLVALYYNTLICYCLSYFFDSFQKKLPWTDCVSAAGDPDSKGHQELFFECSNLTAGRASKFYWYRRTLGVSTGYSDIGGYSWLLLLYHVVAWATIFVILYKGTKFVGSVVYFTAVFPYVVLVIFFIANLAIEPEKRWLGAYRLLKPDWRYLYNPITWLKAGSQIFFSLGLAEGILVTFASYTQARNNCHRDAVSIGLINCGTSVFAALVVFPMIGALGYHKYEECYAQMNQTLSGGNATGGNFSLEPLDKKYDIYFWTAAKNWTEVSVNKSIWVRYGYGEIEKDDKAAYFKNMKNHPDDIFNRVPIDVFDSTVMMTKNLTKALRDCSIGYEATASGGGQGFVFIAFTEAVKLMPGSNFWNCLFFFMLLMLGIDSGFGTVEGIIAAIEDLTHMKRIHATIISCASCFLLAILLFPFGWGIYVLDLIDNWTANWTLLVIALLECISVAWIYGLAKISYDVHLMTGNKPNIYYLICWKYLSPVFIIGMLVGSIAKFIYDTIDKGGIKYSPFDPKHPKAEDGQREVEFPPLPLTMGFLLMIFCISWVPIHYFLRKTKWNMLKEQAFADFPEEELREERNINVDNEEDQFTSVEKTIMGRSSLHNLQEHRDRRASQGDLKGDGKRPSNTSALSGTSNPK